MGRTLGHGGMGSPFSVIADGAYILIDCVRYHLTNRPANDTTDLTGNEGQNYCVVFSENARFVLLLVGHVFNETRMRIN